MDKSTAVLLATVIGGIISSATAYIVATLALKNKLKEMALTKILSAIENIEIFVIKIRSGIEVDQDDMALRRFMWN